MASSLTAGVTAQGAWTDLALHTLGWKSFQDLASHVCEVILNRPVEIFRDAQDGGQDAVFLTKNAADGAPLTATVQCKFSSNASRRLKLIDLKIEEDNILRLVREGSAHTYILLTSMPVDAPVASSLKRKLRDMGVIRPHVFGKEFLTRAIRNNVRLRLRGPIPYIGRA
jgi:hypothetical protein